MATQLKINSQTMTTSLKVYAINLKARLERKEHILQEFKHRDEFDLNLVKAQEHEIGAIGLWLTIKHILEHLINQEEKFIILCEDDHQFTADYNKDQLLFAIQEAEKREADILLGGVSWFTTALQISSNLFWVDRFSGLQFTVIYRKFYKTILDVDFVVGNAADYKISSLTDNKMIMHPFISTQKEFGYSDVTSKNNKKGYVTQIFEDSAEKLGHLKQVGSFYNLGF